MTDKEKIRKEVEKLHGNPYYMMAVKDVLEILDMQEETVSEELEEVAIEICSKILKGETVIIDGYEYIVLSDAEECFKAGAKWQKEQFEKNRLAACDRQTEKEADIECDFVVSIIEKEHRLPTFDDAIKYGMTLQKEQMMKNTTEAT